jgi:hypothetical protein
MAWIEQTKKGSRKSGGPQYYLQDLSENVAALLRARRELPLRLWTPYGMVETGLKAVSKTVGAVEHDRIHKARAGVGQIAEQVAHWHLLKSWDIERIEFADSLDAAALVLSPSSVKFFGRMLPKRVASDSHPLTLTSSHRSPFLGGAFRARLDSCKCCREWILRQVEELVAQHAKAAPNVDERDLLRAAGALHRLGLKLGMYRTKGIDCPDATFELGGLPEYPCQVEIEEQSGGFLDKQHKRHRKERAVVLCMEHDKPEVLSGYTDVIELRSLCSVLKGSA